MTNRAGLLISFDGIDCSGKATQTKELARRLRHQGYTVNLLQTPDYTTETGKKLKALLQDINSWKKLPWQKRLELFAANRLEHRAEVITALQRGHMVIYDRYIPSSLAFFAIEAMEDMPGEAGRRAAYSGVTEVEYQQNKMPVEDVSIFLDVPPATAMSLLQQRKKLRNDKDEYTDQVSVQQKLYNEYDLLTKEHPENYLRISCSIGEELLSVGDVAELVWSGLHERFSQLHKQTL
jgi:dTMP kinase